MRFVKKKFPLVSMLLMFLLFPVLSLDSTYAASPSTPVISDTNGNPVISGEEYLIKVIPKFTGAHLFWQQSAQISGNWVDLTFNFSNSTYKFAGEGVVLEDQPNKIIYAGDGRYLNYQESNLWYPNGGLYLGQEEGSTNFSFLKHSSDDEYLLIADDGPLFVNEEKMSMVTDGGTSQFVVQFIKKKW